MSNLTALQDRVRDIVVDVTAKAEARIVPEIQNAQRELEDAHGFLIMETTLTITTIEGQRGGGATYLKPGLSGGPGGSFFIRSRMDARPVLQDGTGATTEIDWLVAESDIVRLYSDDPDEKGAPRHILERDDHFEIYPLPDKLAPGGSLFSDGNWRVKIPYFTRLTTLTSGGIPPNNWFSDNAEEYLVWQAAGKVLAFNRDHEESLLALQRALAEKNRLIAQDKKARLAKQRLLRPRLGARGSAFQTRTIR